MITSQQSDIILNRRATYANPSSQDEFIVTLLQKKIQEIIFSYGMPALKGDRVLDVGCGNQPFRDILESIGYIYTGFDITQNVEKSVDLIGAIDQPLTSQILSLTPFNFILCTEVMEHVADWDMSFKNFAQLMAPGAKLFITCPHFYQLHEEPHDFWRATPHALNNFANRAGLRTLYQENAGDAWDVLGTLLGACWTFPATNRLIDRIITKLTSVSRQWLFNLLRSRRLQKSVQLNSSLYLSNIALFERA